MATSNSNGWTPERRARQAELIRAWKPWEQSTGPKSPEGKAIASANRQRALDEARQAVQNARRALAEAQANLNRLHRRA